MSIKSVMGIKPFTNFLVGGLSATVPPPQQPIGKQILSGISQQLPESAIKTEVDYTKTVVYGRDDFPPKVREVIKEFGNKPIGKLTIVRHPLADWTVEALNFASFGEFKKRYENEPYEKLYHLGLLITFFDNTSILIEKNEVINTVVNPKIESADEVKPIKHFPQGLTLNIMLEGAKERLGDNLYKYNAGVNNCQSFVNSLIYKFSDIEEDRFVKQNTEQLFKGLPVFSKVVNSVTDLGAKVNEVTEGTGIKPEVQSHYIPNQEVIKPQIQSILFKQPYNKLHAISWLKKHNFKHKDIDDKPNHLRFRQIEPNKKFRYITKKVNDDIEFIIAY
jgi:hypothetical protein